MYSAIQPGKEIHRLLNFTGLFEKTIHRNLGLPAAASSEEGHVHVVILW